jgi:hypothetical protein
MSQVLWNVRLLDLEAGLATERRALTIHEGRISAMGDAAGQLPPEARDFDGATVLAGRGAARRHDRWSAFLPTAGRYRHWLGTVQATRLRTVRQRLPRLSD